jgi:hypothetical protein
MEIKDFTNKQWKYLGADKSILYASSTVLPQATDSIYRHSAIETYKNIPPPFYCHKKRLYIFRNETTIILVDDSMEIRGTMRIKTEDGMIEVIR